MIRAQCRKNLTIVVRVVHREIKCKLQLEMISVLYMGKAVRQIYSMLKICFDRLFGITDMIGLRILSFCQVMVMLDGDGDWVGL